MIVLVGFMGAGKSTVGELLATRLALPFIDTDAVVAGRAGADIARIFAEAGEATFRELEREVVAEVLTGPDAVVALGGGALEDPATCAAVEWAHVVHLDVPFGVAMRRIEGSDRPLLRERDPKDLYDRRAATYARVAQASVATGGRLPEEVAAELERALQTRVDASPAREENVRRVDLPLPGRAYGVFVGAGILDRLGEFLPEFPDAEKAFLISHPVLEDPAKKTAAALETCGLEVQTFLVPEGERSKSLDQTREAYRAMAEAELHRYDVVAGVGGGVVCDLAGFVASTYNRGMTHFYVATTLLAQVDAAIGGKTGVNLEHGKNLVGTIHQPASVVCDVDLLTTLPDEEFRSGMAEVVKYGLIADPGLLETVRAKAEDIFARDPELLIDLVARCAAVKAGYVVADERDDAQRAHLNYGHTFAHAIEHAAGFTGIRHGEAVALGMMAAAYLARELDRLGEDVVDAHRLALEAVGLPTEASLDMDELEQAWRRDKKYRGEVRFVLLAGLGKPEAGISAPPDAVARAIGRMSAA